MSSIRSSSIKRIQKIPRLPEKSLNIYLNDSPDENGGIISINIPSGYENTTILDAYGIYAFGGVSCDDDNVVITKIIIDNVVVLDTENTEYNGLSKIFNGEEYFNNIAGNTPPFLVNESIKIYATNNHPSKTYKCNISLTPVL